MEATTKQSWKPISDDDFDALPLPDGRKTRNEFWKPIMETIESGTSVRIDVDNEQDGRHKRRSVVRRGLLRGFRVDVRNGDGYLAVRKTEELDEPVRAGRRRSPKND